MATPPLSSDVARTIDGRALATAVRREVAEAVRRLVEAGEATPGLATVLIGDDPASAVYVASKRKACAEAGIESFHHELPADVSEAEVFELLDALNRDARVSGILCQLPLPDHLDPEAVTNRIVSAKDVDGLTITNAGLLALGMPGLRPCTPAGVLLLLRHAGVDLDGRHAVVVGRSNLFGKPMMQLLLGEHATVTICHSRTSDLRTRCRDADVLVVAVGCARMVRGDWVKPGAVVIDVGINRVDGRLVGDVALEEVRRVASAITPVPGGVGPMTIACLLRNTLAAARACDVSPSG